MFVQKGKRSISFLCCLALLLSLVPGLNLHQARAEALAKIEPELQSHLDSIGDSDIVAVNIWTEDINYEEVEDEVKTEIGFNSEAFDEIDRYSLFNIWTYYDWLSGSGLYTWEDVITPEHIELSQNVESYKEAELEIAQREYELLHKDFADNHLDEADIIFQGRYAPMVICEISKTELYELAKVPEVVSLGLETPMEFEDFGDLDISIPSIEADTLGLTGDGVRVGQIELSVPNKLNSDLIFDNITNLSVNHEDHATLVAAIVLGKNGLAPDAKLWAISMRSDGTDFYQHTDILVEAGVKVINMSAGAPNGAYDNAAKWVDHLVNTRNITFVVAAGNNGLTNRLVGSPATAYNAVSVGAIDDNGTIDISDDITAPFSSYVTAEENPNPNKPDLMAPGVGFALAEATGPRKEAYIAGHANGTSFAAPMVTGVVAQLMEFYPVLQTRPDLVKAILMASCDRKTPLTIGGAVESMLSLSNRQGAGVINATKARDMAFSFKEEYEDSYDEKLPVGVNSVDIEPVGTFPAEAPVAVALSWFMPHTGTVADGLDNPNQTLTDLDLEVLDKSGSVIAFSRSRSNNAEYLRFTPLADEEYKFRVVRHSSNDRAERFSVAWSSFKGSSRTGISLPETTVMMPGTTEKMPLAVFPVDTTYKRWESSNEAVATVDLNGNVTALDVGETEIKVTVAKHDGEFISRCKVEVVEANVEGDSPKITITTNPESTGTIYTHHTVKVKIEPANPTAGLRIFYTDDGSMPMITSNIYEGELEFTSDSETTIKVVANSRIGTGEPSAPAIAYITFQKPRSINYDSVTEVKVPGTATGEIPEALEDAEYWIDLQSEKLLLPVGFIPTSYTAGGKTKAIKPAVQSLDNDKNPLNHKTSKGKNNFAKLLNKGLRLVLADGAVTVTFEEINPRPKAKLKYKPNFAIGADAKGRTAGDWVLSGDGKTKTTDKIQIGAAIILPNGKPGKIEDEKGYGYFYEGDTAGLPVMPLIGKNKKTTYFIRTEPSAVGGYTPACKPKKLAVSNETKETKYKINAKNKQLKLKKGDYIFVGDITGLARFDGEAVVAGKDTVPVRGVLTYAENAVTVSADGITDAIWVWKEATVKKPATKKQNLQ